ncbi:MAG: hypothetical protein OHK0046_23020 [Anaerolineae bacterium]
MAVTTSQASLARRLAEEIPDIDQGLPVWARRSNPIVRRQLKMYWRTFPPQPVPILRWFALQAGLVVLTVFIPLLFVILLTFLLAAMMLLPYAFALYARTLAYIAAESATALSDEYKNDTLVTLRVTPYSVMEIILSKVAASVWRYMDDFDQVLSFALFLSMPSVAILYLTSWPPQDYPLVAQFMTIVTFAACLIRLPLEMFMVSSLGAMMGAATHMRSSALLSAGVLGFFYFLLINLARLLPMGWVARLLVDAVLPVVLPLVISYVALRITHFFVARD